MSLKEYKTKRNFGRTPEPFGRKGVKHAGEPLFVVQKHDATRLHYDFRLEMHGVLKSWAVPKGFPTKKGDRRLAVEVEDHPLDYADFEGTIPEGSYGAGTVMVWDMGTYHVFGAEPLAGVQSGKLHLVLHGRKLRGEWTLVRMHHAGDGNKPQWLLLKSGVDVPAFSERAETRSALTNRSLEQIARADGPQWESDRPSSAKRPLFASTETATEPLSSPSTKTAAGLGQLPRRKPEFIEPMKAQLVTSVPQGGRWIYEIKFDGIRAEAIKDHQEVRLFSRSANELTAKYPAIADSLRRLRANQAILDGEVVAVDDRGRSSFQLLQSYQRASGKKPSLLYYVFDLLNLEGRDLTGLPLERRKAMLHELLAGDMTPVLYSASIQGDSKEMIHAMRAQGLEGLVAKQNDSKYEHGRRSGAWVKVKWSNEQEFVIGGYTKPKGARTHLGAVLVGYYDNGELLFAGKVGTGFDERLLKSLFQQFQKLVTPDCPFANLPEKPTAFGGRGLTSAQMRSCTWLKPRLVCQVRFAEWTRDNHLRQPVFLGLREDKKSEDVLREAA